MWLVKATNSSLQLLTLVYRTKSGAGTFWAVFFPLFFCQSYSVFANPIHVWHKNQSVASTFEFIELGLQKTQYPHEFNVKTIEGNDDAFQASPSLVKQHIYLYIFLWTVDS